MRDTDRKGLSLRLLLPLLGVGIIVLVAAAILLSRQAALAAPEQPIAFSYNIHAEAGVACLFCHPNAMRSDIAGIPSVAKCVGCHKTIATESDQIQLVLEYWERSEPIPWQTVVKMADHVFFSHQPHLSAGVSCESCHGDVSEMSVARPALVMDMGWCLDCHLEQPEERVAWLADCLVCHK